MFILVVVFFSTRMSLCYQGTFPKFSWKLPTLRQLIYGEHVLCNHVIYVLVYYQCWQYVAKKFIDPVLDGFSPTSPIQLPIIVTDRMLCVEASASCHFTLSAPLKFLVTIFLSNGVNIGIQFKWGWKSFTALRFRRSPRNQIKLLRLMWEHFSHFDLMIRP